MCGETGENWEQEIDRVVNVMKIRCLQYIFIIYAAYISYDNLSCGAKLYKLISVRHFYI